MEAAALGGGLLTQGRTGEAILDLEEQLLVYPGNADTRALLASVVAQKHVTYLDHARFHNELGLEWAAKGDLSKAAWHFEKALRYEPGSPSILANLAAARKGNAPPGLTTTRPGSTLPQ